ncbi:MAG: hypothetical protein EF813_00920 [Methanosarcinales archaeon]|nr:MAG: hypothetical protein EF813_00920 [Methanosarcinales archaeon]
MGFFTGRGRIFVLCSVIVLLTVAQERNSIVCAQPELLISAPGAATIGRSVEVAVTSAGDPVPGVIVFFTFRNSDMQVQQTTDELGVVMFAPDDAGRLCVFAHKRGFVGAEVVVDVRGAPEYFSPVNKTSAAHPVGADAGSPGFGGVVPIILLMCAIRNILNR